LVNRTSIDPYAQMLRPSSQRIAIIAGKMTAPLHHGASLIPIMVWHGRRGRDDFAHPSMCTGGWR
jgi:hypothetical protein